jgi:hypothetical protein
LVPHYLNLAFLSHHPFLISFKFHFKDFWVCKILESNGWFYKPMMRRLVLDPN